MKKLKRIVICILAIIVCFAFMPAQSAFCVDYSKFTNDSIKAKQAQLEKAKEQIKNLNKSISDSKKVLADINAKKNEISEYITELDASITEANYNIGVLSLAIEEKEGEIRVTEEELNAALIKENEQLIATVHRIQLMYERGDAALLEIFLHADGFNDFLNRADYVECVMLYDKTKWEEFQESRILVELYKEELELEKEYLNTAKAELENEEALLEELKIQKENELRDYSDLAVAQEEAIMKDEYEAQLEKALQDTLEKAILQEQEELYKKTLVQMTYDGGTFVVPLASYTRVSSEFSPARKHPVTGVVRAHNGVDLASPGGTAIYAAYKGTVSDAGYNDSMGNYVIINHGDNLYTYYMHASKLYVKKGDKVTTGQTIAAVGSTGLSTGNHLHFGVNKDGAYVDPREYVVLKK